MSDAIVVGAGPNGLAAAVALARGGLKVTVHEAADVTGGGTKTSELTVPGVLHDHCSAVHPMAAASPFLTTLGLGRHGLEWCYPEVDLAHPLDDGSAGVLLRDVQATADGLGQDGRASKALFAGPAKGFDGLLDDLMKPIAHVPAHPLRLTRFGPPALLPATVLTRRFKTRRGRRCSAASPRTRSARSDSR